MVDHDLSFRGRFLECGSSTSLMNSLRSTSESDKEALSLELLVAAIRGIMLLGVVVVVVD